MYLILIGAVIVIGLVAAMLAMSVLFQVNEHGLVSARRDYYHRWQHAQLWLTDADYRRRCRLLKEYDNLFLSLAAVDASRRLGQSCGWSSLSPCDLRTASVRFLREITVPDILLLSKALADRHGCDEVPLRDFLHVERRAANMRPKGVSGHHQRFCDLLVRLASNAGHDAAQP